MPHLHANRCGRFNEDVMTMCCSIVERRRRKGPMSDQDQEGKDEDKEEEEEQGMEASKIKKRTPRPGIEPGSPA